MFKEIDKKKKLLDIKRPLPTYTLKSLREKLLLEWTHNSNAIEGNTLTLSETKVVLEGITVGGKSLKEHLEIINHKEAILYVEEIVKSKELFSERQIKNIHSLVLKGIDNKYAGTYRDQQVFISGAQHVPPEPIRITEDMEGLLKWYHGQAQDMHPVERAAFLHIKFVGIHPFVDGNGRTARLLLNLELMKHGFPPIIIRVENRVAYYDALDKAHTTDHTEGFVRLVIEELNKSFDLYLR